MLLVGPGAPTVIDFSSSSTAGSDTVLNSEGSRTPFMVKPTQAGEAASPPPTTADTMGQHGRSEASQRPSADSDGTQGRYCSAICVTTP
jgi:hypothetical protein